MQRHLFQNPTNELPGQRFLFDPDVAESTPSPWHQSPTIQAIVSDHRAIAERIQRAVRAHRNAKKPQPTPPRPDVPTSPAPPRKQSAKTS